jgi:hypothetical protein
MLSEGKPMISTTFLTNPSKIKMYNETVLQLCEDMSAQANNGKLSEKYKSMYSKAKKIFDTQKSTSNEADKIKNTRKFYEEYGEAIARSMNFLNM